MMKKEVGDIIKWFSTRKFGLVYDFFPRRSLHRLAVLSYSGHLLLTFYGDSINGNNQCISEFRDKGLTECFNRAYNAVNELVQSNTCISCGGVGCEVCNNSGADLCSCLNRQGGRS